MNAGESEIGKCLFSACPPASVTSRKETPETPMLGPKTRFSVQKNWMHAPMRFFVRKRYAIILQYEGELSVTFFSTENACAAICPSEAMNQRVCKGLLRIRLKPCDAFSLLLCVTTMSLVSITEREDCESNRRRMKTNTKNPVNYFSLNYSMNYFSLNYLNELLLQKRRRPLYPRLAQPFALERT